MKDMLSTMLVLAVNGHDGQLDKGGNPYILHCLKVMHYLKTDDKEIQAIAVGHDLFEDTDITKQTLRENGISERVIHGIDCMTKRADDTEDSYLQRVCSNPDSMRVKLADLRHNSDIRRLKGVRTKDIQRIEKYHRMYLYISARMPQHADVSDF